MADYVLNTEAREVVGKKVNTLRRKGIVPITVYGPAMEPLSLQVPYKHLELTLRDAGGTNLIELKVAGQTHTVLAREVQRDVVRGDILHADFFALDLASKVTTDVQVVLVGEPENQEGILLSGTSMVTIETLPSKLISVIEIDVTVLKEIGDTITVADVDLGDDIVILNDPEEMLARLTITSAERAEEELEDEEGAVDMGAEPEVISRGREDEEDEE